MTHLNVLIVGAGPAGLMMACELERHGIPFRIIDKRSLPTKGSNATWIQTRTLEIFDAMGIVDRFLKIGHQCDAINFYGKGKQLASLPLQQIDSPYPFILMLPQSQTEQLLTEKLKSAKITIERSLELIDIKQTSKGVISTIRRANGDTEVIKSDWVIGCDGANSTVREKCQMTFPGEDLSEQFMVADAKMSSYLPTNEIHVFFDKGAIFPDKRTLFSAFPWGSKDYRLTANLYLSHPRQNFTEQEVKEIVSERSYGNYIVESVSWISPFWIHGKIVKKMQDNFIFLVGDAAHIHSPAGGQGMNTGIQDAFNLAWKLALVIKHKANANLLNTYQLERYPVAKEIVKKTEYLTKMALFDKTFFSTLINFGDKISKRPSLAKNISNQLSQLNIRYKNSPIINYKSKLSIKSPRQGEIAPNVVINDSETLYRYLRHPLHTILLFVGKQPTKQTLIKINKLQKLLNKKLAKTAKTFIITKEALKDSKDIIPDLNSTLHKCYNVTKPAIYIVRPDNYIGCYSKQLNINSIKTFFTKHKS